MASKTMSDYEKKLLEMRLQMNENQAYLQDAFGDLENWTKEMNEKEKEVVNNPNILKNNSTKGLPPIRNLTTKKKKKRVVKKADTQKSDHKAKQKLNSYDYRAWDKLDVDKLCEEVDESKTDSSEYTTDEEWEQEQRLSKAEWEKERGNHFFKNNLLAEATECYSKAIELNPNNAIYLANRAMCYIKENRYAAAEVDCSMSITLDPKYAKAYHRRATARMNLGKLTEARADYQKLLELEPESKLAQIELNKLENQLEKNNLVFPVIKSENEKSKKPLVRIKIEEINVEESSAERIKLKQNIIEIQQKVKLSKKDEELFNINKKETDQGSSKSFDSNLPKRIVSELKVDQLKINPQPKVIPECPKNAYQFKKDWQYLCENLENLAAYFKKIPSNEYSKLFLNGLESDNLAKILEIFNKHMKNDPSVDLFNSLKHLSQVKRFQTQMMFLSQSDKSNLEEVIEHLKKSEIVDKHQLESLVKSLAIS